MSITANIFSDALAPLINIFDKVLVAIHGVVGSWGWSIIALTVLIRMALIPLTLKQIRSMQAMREFAPEIKALQEKYKGDRQKLNEETMKFYRENQINPFASCLPLLAQAPVFISLFYMLQLDLKKHICPSVTTYATDVVDKSVNSIACGQVPAFTYGGQSYPKPTGQEFLFIPDLTANATGWVLAVLILMYVGSQLGSTLVMMSPTMDKTQRYIMFALPLFFVIFIVNFPAGLMVYWITTNLWTVGQQFVVKKTSPPVEAVATAGAPSASAKAKASSQPKKKGGLMDRLLEASAAASEEASTRKSSGGGSPKEKPAPADSRSSGGKQSGGEASSKDEGPGSGPKAKSGPPPSKNKKKRTGRRR